uniref:Uncharacterized protein n=1 Tax=Caenorhabditis japonica TaxID=281687 RepID=A0A8R1ETK4_CAEJA
MKPQNLYCFCAVLGVLFSVGQTDDWLKDLNLPRQLLEYHVSSKAQLRVKCIQDPECNINNPSELLCSDDLTHCVGKNIFFDFSNLNIKSSKRYRQDVIVKRGQVGGKCAKFDRAILENNSKIKGYLMSW